jgi:hypothetical protein
MTFLRTPKRAFLLLTAVFALPAAGSAKSSPVVHHYQCSNGERFVVARSGSVAVVRVGSLAYKLPRKRSSLGQKYGSEIATLIIDGPSAVFKSERHLHLRDCIETRFLAQRG